MAFTRLLFVVACVLLWTAVTACASADPASQPTSTQTVASLSSPSPTAGAVDAVVTSSVVKSVSGTDQTASEDDNDKALASPTAEHVLVSSDADTSETELDCTHEANRCDPACLTAVPSSRLFLPSVGDTAYRFNLPSTVGPEHSLESYRGESNVVLVFYRAFW